LAKILRYLISQLPPRLVFSFAIALPLSLLFHSFRFEEDKSTQESKVKICITANQRANLGLAPFSFSGNGGSADATQDFAPASTNLPLDFAHSHFAQQFMFSAQAPSTPALIIRKVALVTTSILFLSI